MAKGTPKPGSGAPKKGGGSGVVAGSKPVGYGQKGNPFYNKAKFNASKSGPIQSKGGTPGTTHQPPPHVPMPGHPSNNPTHVHGPATIGRIAGPPAPGRGLRK